MTGLVEQQASRVPAWFSDMFRYGASSPVAAQQASALLLDPAFLTDDTISGHAGSAIFNALADACPDAAVTALERTVHA